MSLCSFAGQYSCSQRWPCGPLASATSSGGVHVAEESVYLLLARRGLEPQRARRRDGRCDARRWVRLPRDLGVGQCVFSSKSSGHRTSQFLSQYSRLQTWELLMHQPTWQDAPLAKCGFVLCVLLTRACVASHATPGVGRKTFLCEISPAGRVERYRGLVALGACDEGLYLVQVGIWVVVWGGDCHLDRPEVEQGQDRRRDGEGMGDDCS